MKDGVKIVKCPMCKTINTLTIKKVLKCQRCGFEWLFNPKDRSVTRWWKDGNNRRNPRSRSDISGGSKRYK